MSRAMAQRKNETQRFAALSAELPTATVPLISGEHLHFFCGRRPAGEIPPHRHEQLEISILFEPAVCSVSWGSPPAPALAMHGPAILLVAPQQLHACRWERDADVIVLHIERPLQRELRLQRSACTPALPLTSHDRAIWDIASGLRLMCLEDNPAESRALALVARSLAYRAMELVGRKSSAAGGAALEDEEFRRVEQHIVDHLGHPIHAIDLARCVGYSLQHFNALFKARTGITAAAFLMQSRMAKAKELFVGGARTIKTVAEAVGYYAPGNFTAKFREHFGISPRQLIAQVRAQSADRRRISSERP